MRETLPWPVLIGALLLVTSWMLWLTFRRANRQRLALRAGAVLLVAVCFVLLAFPPRVPRVLARSEAILLSPGYHPDSLAALQRRNPALRLIYAFGADTTGRFPVIQDLVAFRREHPSVQTVHVLGQGLPEETLPHLSGLRVVPHLSPLPAGFLSASWPRNLTAGETFMVQGTYQAQKVPATLYLSASGKRMDSVVLKTLGQVPFQLRFTPKTTGRAVYHLQGAGPGGAAAQEDLPLLIHPPVQVAVLLLSAAPSFEAKFLKNELARQGHQVGVRTQVSQGIFQEEFINLPAQKLQRLSAAALKKFDLVVLDYEALGALTSAERQALQTAVREQGLGLLTLVTSEAPKAMPFFGEGVFKPFSGKQAKNAMLGFKGSAHLLPIEAPHSYVNLTVQQQPLAWVGKSENALVWQYRKGLGQVGVSLVSATFPWQLAGQEKGYRHYWSTLVKALIKPAAAPPTLQVSGLEPPRAHQSLELLAQAPVSRLVSVYDTSGSASVITTPSPLLSGLYSATAWASTAGWYSSAGSDTVGALYVHRSDAWPIGKLAERQRKLLALAQDSSVLSSSQVITVAEPMPLWPIALGLLLGLAFLWLEEKV